MPTEDNPQVSVIVPINNEEGNLSGLFHELQLVMETTGQSYEIVAVDDGSDDGTLHELLRLPFVLTVSHPYNKGNGAAVKTGIRNATGRLVILMDGDAQHDPKDIPKLLEYAENYELLVGSRTNSQSQSRPRRLANGFFNWLATYVSGQKILDLTSGFRVAHRDKIARFLPLFPNGFSYPATSTLAFIKSGFSVKFIPVTMRKRKGKSKITPLRDGLRFFLIVVKTTVLFSPLKVFTPVSLLCVLLGVLHAFYKILILHMRYTSLSVLFITTGLLIFLIGLVSEQIAIMRFEQINQDR